MKVENVKDIFEAVKVGVALAGGFLVKLLGGYDMLLKFLVGLMIADYILGVSSAIMNKEINSKKGFIGIARKVYMLVPIGLACGLDHILETDGILRYSAIIFYSVNESFSIVENLGKMGVPFPKKILKVLEQLRDEVESEDEAKE